LSERLYSIVVNLIGLLVAYISYALIIKVLIISHIPQQISGLISYLAPMLIGYMLYKKYHLVIGRFVMLVSLFYLCLNFLTRPFG